MNDLSISTKGVIIINMGVFPLEEKEKRFPFGYFCLVKCREGPPYFYWNYSLDIMDTLRFYWNNIVWSKNNKRRNNDIMLSFYIFFDSGVDIG